jgi:hypothetical protein
MKMARGQSAIEQQPGEQRVFAASVILGLDRESGWCGLIGNDYVGRFEGQWLPKKRKSGSKADAISVRRTSARSTLRTPRLRCDDGEPRCCASWPWGIR